MSRYWSELVHALTPYTPGEQPQMKNLVKLNTNENPYGPSPEVLAAIEAASTDALRMYPDPSATRLRQTIANYYGLAAENVFVGNSSDEVLAHVFRALLVQNLPIEFPDITYSFYPVYCALFGIDYKTVPLQPDFTLNVNDFSQANGGVIFANPNAPTGIALMPSEIERLLQRNTNSVVVVDEAYADFSEASSIALLDKYPNLLITQTLSKSRSLAGLRVGLALASAELVAGLERVKNSFHPYALDALALAGAQAAFEDEMYFKATCEKVINTRDSTAHALVQLGFEVIPSDANFLFVRHPTKPAAELFSGLRAQGVVVRYFDKSRLDQHLRISIGTDQDMARLLEVLTALLQ